MRSCTCTPARLAIGFLSFATLLLSAMAFASEVNLIRRDGYVEVRLIPARPLAPREVWAVQVDTGPLIDGDLVVADETGTVAGAVAPFGLSARKKPASALIVIPRQAAVTTEIVLRLWVEEPQVPGGRRAPEHSEIEALRLVPVPAE